jgi:hypothetical protein
MTNAAWPLLGVAILVLAFALLCILVCLFFLVSIQSANNQAEGFTSEIIPYDPAENSAKSYNLAIRSLRLQGVADGSLEPIANDPEEMAVWSRRQQR